MLHVRHALVVPLLLSALAGCGEEAEVDHPPAGEHMDTINQGAMDGLSREQIRERAEAMTPERAQELGIVDTTIHVESLTSDSFGHPPDPLAAAAARAEAARDSAARDSAP